MDSLDDGIAGPIWPVLTPFTLVAIAVGIRVDSPAVPLTATPLTLVASTARPRVDAFAIPLRLVHLSHVLRNDAIVEPLHGPATRGATVRAATSAPCYNFTGLGSLIPDPTGGSGVDGPARTIRSGQRVRRRRRRPWLS